MSYASVASHKAPPPSLQPHADPALLNTTAPSHNNVADDTAKVGFVSPDFKENPATVTSKHEVFTDSEYDNLTTGVGPDSSSNASDKKQLKKKANKGLAEAEAEGQYLWETTKQYLFRPGVAGGLIGLVNIGIIAGVGHAFYNQTHLRRDTKVISSTVAGAIALISVEGFAAERYSKTPRGQDEARRAKEEGAVLYKHAREIVLRPGVMGGLFGLVNTAVLGTVGYYSYINWDKPTWDRRTVSAVSVGLLALWGGEGVVAERYRQSRH